MPLRTLTPFKFPITARTGKIERTAPHSHPRGHTLTKPNWQPDVLGDGWQAHTIPLGADAEGPLEATLVRAPGGARHKTAVLYIHGFVDYFFQTGFAAAVQAQGYDFYAIDLHKYGRSLREGQTPNYTDRLSDYAAEIDEAAHIIRTEEKHEHLIVVGHSTGGLIASLWANARPDLVDGVVLNSPWFDLNESWLLRTAGTRAIDVIGKFAPHIEVGSLGRHYGTALHTNTGGEWNYNLDWKPQAGFPVYAGWLRTVRRSQARIAGGLNIYAPVLVCTSTESGDNKHAHDAILTTDSVLDVQHMLEHAGKLGPQVTIAQIPHGAHDLALSAEPARSVYATTVTSWLNKHFGEKSAPEATPQQ